MVYNTLWCLNKHRPSAKQYVSTGNCETNILNLKKLSSKIIAACFLKQIAVKSTKINHNAEYRTNWIFLFLTSLFLTRKNSNLETLEDTWQIAFIKHFFSSREIKDFWEAYLYDITLCLKSYVYKKKFQKLTNFLCNPFKPGKHVKIY